MATREIQRWVDDSSGVEASLREALRDAAREAPSSAQLDKLIAGVDSALRVPAGGSPRPSLIALGCAGMMLVSAGAWLAHRHYVTPVPPAAATPPSPQVTPEPEPQLQPEPQPEPDLPPPPSASTPPAAQPTAAAPHPPRRARPTPPPAAPRAPADPADPAQEVLLLRDAKRALIPAPARAHQLLLEHQRSYAHGAFVEEREALLIELSLRQGDAQQARTRATAFRKRFAGSAYQRRLDDLLRAADEPR